MIVFPLMSLESYNFKKDFLNIIIAGNLCQVVITSLVAIDPYLRLNQSGQNTSLIILVDSLMMSFLVAFSLYLKYISMSQNKFKWFQLCNQLINTLSSLLNISLLNIIYHGNKMVFNLNKLKNYTLYLGPKILLQLVNISDYKFLLIYLVGIIILVTSLGNLWSQSFPYYALFMVLVYALLFKRTSDIVMRRFVKQIKQNNELQNSINENQFYQLQENLLNTPFCVFNSQGNLFNSQKLHSEILQFQDKPLEVFLDTLQGPTDINIMERVLQCFTESIGLNSAQRYEDCQCPILDAKKYSTNHKSQFTKYKGSKPTNFVTNSLDFKNDFDQHIYQSLTPINSKQKVQQKIQNSNIFSDQKDLSVSISEKYDISLIEYFWQEEKRVLLKIDSRQPSQELIKLKKELTDMKNQDIYKDNLLASVSHDFKTPLNAMLAIVQYLLGQSNLDQQIINYLKMIGQNAHLIIFMIADLLDYTRIQKNELRLCWSQFQIQEVVQVLYHYYITKKEVIDLVSIQAQEKNIQLYLNCKLNYGTMYSDPNRIKQIILNLLSNSLKFTNNGSITVDISNEIIETRKSPKKKQRRMFQNQIKQISSINCDEAIVIISVKDTGVGMPPDVISRLFNQYVTFDYNNGSNKHGVGLGLVICKKLVGMLGPLESIQVESTPDCGSKFSFSIFAYMTDQQTSYQSIPKSKYINVQRDSPYKQNQSQASQILVFQTSRSPLPPIRQGLNDIHQIDALNLVEIQISPSQSYQNKTNIFQFQGDIDCEINHDKIIDNEIEQEDAKHSKSKNVSQLQSRIQPSIFDKFMEPEYKDISNSEIQFNDVQIVEQVVTSEDIIKRINPPGSKILVVDDQPFNVLAIKLLFKAFNWIVIDCAYDGKMALSMKKKSGTKYSFIFLDIQMPIMDGYKIVAEIRKYENQFVHVNRIIAVTGFDDEKEKQNCLQAGFDAFISKPLKLDGITEVMKQLYYI